jgi:DNA-binding GntR family transcriptional regulator
MAEGVVKRVQGSGFRVQKEENGETSTLTPEP